MVFVGLKTYVNYLPRSALSSSNNLTPCSCESKILKDQIDLPVLINLFLQKEKRVHSFKRVYKLLSSIYNICTIFILSQ